MGFYYCRLISRHSVFACWHIVKGFKITTDKSGNTGSMMKEKSRPLIECFSSVIYFKYIKTWKVMAIFIILFQTGSTALYLASQQGHNDVVKLLFEFGASTEFQTKVCSRVLTVYITIVNSDCDWVSPAEKRKQCGSQNIRFRLCALALKQQQLSCLSCVFLCQDGGTALTVASQYGHSKVVDTLLKNGANVHDQLNVSTSSHLQLPSDLSGTWWLAAHNVSANGIQSLRFQQTAESDTLDIWQDYSLSFAWRKQPSCTNINLYNE